MSDVFVEFDTAPSKEVSTTTAHTRLLRGLLKDPSLGPSVVPIVADEGRTFGFESLYAEFGVHLPPSGVGSYRAADADMALRYNEQRNGRFLQAGISEASAMALFNAAGQMGYRGPSLFPIFEFYSMFGFQRIGDFHAPRRAPDDAEVFAVERHLDRMPDHSKIEIKPLVLAEN